MTERRVTIIDHHINNLRSIANACRALGAEVHFAREGSELEDAGHVILPGVGAFGSSMHNLVERGFVEAIHAHCDAGRPFFGICLGFQVMFNKGTEHGECEGLGLFQGTIDRFETDLHVPHVGWNILQKEREHALLSDLDDDPHMYFVHSFHPRGVDPSVVLGTSDYGERFVCMVARDNVAGAQFHPEKSGADGLRILLNYLDWRP